MVFLLPGTGPELLTVASDCSTWPSPAHPAPRGTWAGHAHQGHELQPLQEFAVPVLQAMCLINDHTAPLDLLQLWAVSKDHLKGGDNHLELEDPRERVTLGKQKPDFESCRVAAHRPLV